MLPVAGGAGVDRQVPQPLVVGVFDDGVLEFADDQLVSAERQFGCPGGYLMGVGPLPQVAAPWSFETGGPGSNSLALVD